MSDSDPREKNRELEEYRLYQEYELKRLELMNQPNVYQTAQPPSLSDSPSTAAEPSNQGQEVRVLSHTNPPEIGPIPPSPPITVDVSPMPSSNAINSSLDTIVTSTMTCTEIIAVLANHSCADLTSSIDEFACSRYPIANGGLGDVFSGRLLNGTSVAIKTLRAYYDQGQLSRVYHKRAAREIHTWSKCKHPNVVELIGLAVFRDCLAMISRWEVNGNLSNYLLRHPDADRCQLSTLICAGLVYLHENDIIHGDLKGANVLIAQDGRPMIMDFGNASLLDATLQFTQTNTGAKFSLRWAAPELLGGTTTSHTTAGDIYSLGMTILETFTSKIPYADKMEWSLPIHVVVQKNIPTRPEEIIPKKSICGDKLWEILTKCWSFDPANRPSAEYVWNTLKEITPDKLVEMKTDEVEMAGSA